MTFDKSLLHHFVCDALGPYAEDFAVRDKKNPVEIQFNGHLYFIHISYVHDSGNHRDNEDEVRVQISRNLIEQQRLNHENGRRVTFIGFFEYGKVFVAWDPRHIFALQAETVVSVYARSSQKEKVETQSAAVHQFNPKFLNETSFAIALPSDVLGFYLENAAHFHQLQSEDSIRSLSHENDKILDYGKENSIGDFEIEKERKRFVFTRKNYPRDPLFKKHVLKAYDCACCICNRQLAIVQAAHIIPHSEPDCPNTVNNGLALCIEHHRLYDDALLLPGSSGRLVFNDERAEYLCQTKQERGIDDIKAQHDQEFNVPPRVGWHPSKEYLERGLQIRLGR